MNKLILLRGGGDLASGVALRLHHSGFQVVITELPRPLAVRRLVSFSEAVYAGQITVEDVTARLVTPDQIEVTLARGEIPVLVDPDADILNYAITLYAVVDARLIKTPPHPCRLPSRFTSDLGLDSAPDATATLSSKPAAVTPSDASTGTAKPPPTAANPTATRAASCARHPMAS